MSITPPVRVIACHIRWPLKLFGHLIYRLIVEADGGDFVSAKPPDIYDHTGAPTTLNAELAAGSVVRVSLSDDGATMVAVQLLQPIFDNPFALLVLAPIRRKWAPRFVNCLYNTRESKGTRAASARPSTANSQRVLRRTLSALTSDG